MTFQEFIDIYTGNDPAYGRVLKVTASAADGSDILTNSDPVYGRRIKVDIAGGGGGVQSVVAGTNITVDNTDPANPIVSSTADDITVVANFSALPAPSTVSGQFYWCSASEGSNWNPFAGAFRNSGLYYSNGVSWEFLDVPYQATQATVNAGTNTNQFVTPATLASATTVIGSTGITGDLISFSASNTPSRIADVATGNVLLSGGVATLPLWGKVGLTTHVSGTLPIANGGTNSTSLTTNGLMYFDGTSITNNSTVRANSSGVGFGTAATSSFFINALGTVNNTYGQFLQNTSSGTSAYTQIGMQNNGSNIFRFGVVGTATTTSGIYVQNTSYAAVDGLFNIGTTNANPLSFWTNNLERARILSTGEFLLGRTTLIGTESATFEKSQNNTTTLFISNPNAGNGAYAQIGAHNGTTNSSLGINGTGVTGGGLFGTANLGYCGSSHSSGFAVHASNASGNLFFYTGGSATANLKVRIDQNSNVILNSTGSALSTSATNGFTYIPSCAGIPTGVPATLPTGAIPVIIDSTNNKMYIYSGGSWVPLN